MLDRGNSVVTAQERPVQADMLLQNWEQLKSILQRDIGDNNFRNWILPIAPLSFSAGVLELGVPTRFMRDWVRTHYADRIRTTWGQQIETVNRVDVVVSTEAAAKTTAVAMQSAANDVRTAKSTDFSSPLDARYTFESFVTGKSNDMAAAAAQKLATSDKVLFNPLCVHGGVGMGKTHLLQATAAAIRARRPDARIVYMSAEKFMYHFVQSLREKEMMSFKSFFRNVDVLMMDDIQFICGKGSTQEEFLHTFNALLGEGKQVVIAADRSPADLDGIDERLRSRLGMGLVVRIDTADYDMRLAVLKSKCAFLKRNIPEEVLVFLAEKITSNIRELEGALNRLIANAELLGREMTLDTARDLLQDLVRVDVRRVQVEDIQKVVAAHYNIRVADILSPRRARPVARPRQVAMYLSKDLTECSLPDIGRRFGGRDHTTIMHGVRKITELMTTDVQIARDVESLKRALMG